jgi:hypothetical protein
MRMRIAGGSHGTFGPVNMTVTELGPWPDQQVARTVGVMKARAVEDAGNPTFKARAAGIAGMGGDLDKVGRIYNHVKGSIRFERDEPIAAGIAGLNDPSNVVEVIIRPVDMAGYVENGVAVGDCDDFSMYLAAMLEAVGIPSAFVTVAADGGAPDQYSHVYVVAWPVDEDGNRVRVACDASHGEYPGWEVPNQFGKLREWPVGDCGGGGFLTLVAGVAAAWAAWWAWKKWGGVAA